MCTQPFTQPLHRIFLGWAQCGGKTNPCITPHTKHSRALLHPVKDSDMRKEFRQPGEDELLPRQLIRPMNAC